MLIAQISDLHLRADASLMHGQIDTIRALELTIAHVNRLDPSADVVLATGDLADGGFPEDYALLRRMLNGLAMPVYVIPGNHDDRGRLRSTFADRGYLPATGDFLHYTVEHYPVRLIGLDTVLPGRIGGGLCPPRLDWLEQRLGEQPGRPTLVFMHHPPFASGIGFLDQHAFEGTDALARLIARHGQVRQVVCGHIHRAASLSWAGTSASIAPSTVYQMNLALRPGTGFSLTQDPPAISLHLWPSVAESPLTFISLIDHGSESRRPPADTPH